MEQAHAREPDRDNWYVSLGKTGWRMVLVKKSDLRRLAGILTEEFDRLASGDLLSAIELAKVKHLRAHLRCGGFRRHSSRGALCHPCGVFTAEEHSI
jgi:hypothetical protein